MTKECFLKQFADSKDRMDLNEAAERIHQMLDDYPLLPKCGQRNRLGYVHRRAQRTACMALEAAMRESSPWKDWREIIAEHEWMYMRRAAAHALDGRWKGPDGEHWGKADGWNVEMWMAFHEIYLRMPGTMPDVTAWRIFNSLMANIERETRKFRRKL